MSDDRGVARDCRKRLPVTIATVAIVPLVICFAAAPRPAAQSQAPPASRPAFEVASVKPTRSEGQRGGRIQPGRFAQTNVTLRQLIQMAHGRRSVEIAGGPSWMDSDRFDVEATGDFSLAGYLPGADGSPPMVYSMLQTLLADRFKLAVHVETRELPVYALVTMRRGRRLGPQLRQSNVDCAAVTAATLKTGRPPERPDPRKGPPCSTRVDPGRVTGNALTMSQFAGVLSGPANRVVVDRTGLTGNFDIDLEWTPELRAAAPDSNAATDRPVDAAPSLFTALQEQLGLRLNAERGPVDVLIVDRAERPAPN